MPKPPAEPKLPDGFEPRMLSFDVYGTLVNTPSAQLGAFRAILADAGRPDLDPEAFYSFWEQRNIAHYYEPYRTYKDICRLSLSEAYERFGVAAGREEAIQRYFDYFSAMELYPDVLPTLDALARGHKLALVSNIDDDLLGDTPLGREFDSSAPPRGRAATSRTGRSSAISWRRRGCPSRTYCTQGSRSSPTWWAESRSASPSPGSTGAASTWTREFPLPT